MGGEGSCYLLVQWYGPSHQVFFSMLLAVQLVPFRLEWSIIGLTAVAELPPFGIRCERSTRDVYLAERCHLDSAVIDSDLFRILLLVTNK